MTVTLVKTPYSSHVMMRLQSDSIEALPPSDPVDLNPVQQVQELIEQMIEDRYTLPHEHQEEVFQIIRKWEELFFSDYQIDSPVDSKREDAAHALLFFRLNNIEYIMLNYAKGVDNKVIWLKSYNRLKTIAASILPTHINVEAFVEIDKQKHLVFKFRYKAKQIIKEIIQKAKTLIDQLKQQLYDEANVVASDLQIEFEAIKEILRNLNRDSKVATEEFHGDIDELTKEVSQIHQNLEKQLNESDVIGQKKKAEEEALMNLLKTCEAVVNRI